MGLLGKVDKGLVFIISAPAGTGKTTLVCKLLKEFPNDVVKSVSCTTRPLRENEVAGKDYHPISDDDFSKRQQNGEFLETADVFSYKYGTLRSDVDGPTSQGKHVILVIDTQGAMYLKDKIDATFIFLYPPSMEELERRLRSRKTEKEETILERLSWADKELKLADKYDYVIINDKLDLAYEELKQVIIKEEKLRRQA